MNESNKQGLPSYGRAFKKLFTLWVGVSVFLILLIFFQTIGGKYGADANRAWAWLIENIILSLVLIPVSFLRIKKISDYRMGKTEAILFRLLFYVSIVFLVTLLLNILLQPLGNSNKSEIEKLRNADTGLYVFQGFLLIILAIYISKTWKPVLHPDTEDILSNFDDELRVFISYNHVDKISALKIKTLLEKENIKVVIDSEAMMAGEDIETFIRRSIKSSRVTLSIISRKGLLSGWVSTETIDTLFLAKYTTGRKFIACYLDDDFMAAGFTNEAIQHINNQLEEINLQIDRRKDLAVDSRDLNDQKTRLISLKNNFDMIINKLQQSLCVDIRDEKMVETFPLILRTIQSA